MVPEAQSMEGTADPKLSSQENNGKDKRKPGGWRTMPFILGNETFERLASMGLLANFMVYLRRVYHLNQVSATSLISIWSSVTNFTPLVGAFISDAYVGRYWTIAFGSIASFLGMVAMTMTAWLPKLHPPSCTAEQQETGECIGVTPPQLGFLMMSLIFLSMGTAGIRPCSIPFGVDQFDSTTEEGRKGLSSFYNWYYVTFTIILVIASTVVVYIQDSISWVLGYGIPTLLMFCAILLFFLGTRVYIYVKPEGSIFTGLAQVIVAAYKKRNLPSNNSHVDQVDRTALYDPPLDPTSSVKIIKLPLTNKFRFLDKAAIVVEKELNPDGSRVNPWNLCTVQQVEELKCLIRVAPIWLVGIFSMLPILQQSTFTVSQALQMDRHMGPHFQIPAGSVGVITFLTVSIAIPLYDQLIVPQLRKITKHESGITPLQRMGVGIVFSILSMIVAGFTEIKRRDAANKFILNSPSSQSSYHVVAPMSVFWLSPQHILMGLCEGFNIIGSIEFFNMEFPEHMRTMGNALSSCTLAVSSYISTLIVIIVHKTTGGHGKHDWLTDDLNVGRLDYFYFIVAGIAFLGFFVFLYTAKQYQYKGTADIMKNETNPCDHDQDIMEIRDVKKLGV